MGIYKFNNDISIKIRNYRLSSYNIYYSRTGLYGRVTKQQQISAVFDKSRRQQDLSKAAIEEQFN